MARHLIPLLGIALLLGACGGSSDDATELTTAVVDPIETVATAAPSNQTGGIGGAVAIAVDGLNGADTAACDLDRSTLTSALEMYAALNGTPPTSQLELVDAQLITELSSRFDITTEGVVVPAPGSPCT